MPSNVNSGGAFVCGTFIVGGSRAGGVELFAQLVHLVAVELSGYFIEVFALVWAATKLLYAEGVEDGGDLARVEFHS